MRKPPVARRHHTLPVAYYDLDSTLDSGQSFAWHRIPPRSPDFEPRSEGSWEGVVAGRWVQLQQGASCLHVTVAQTPPDWTWLTDYLQTSIDLAALVAQLPLDPLLHQAHRAFPGLRLLRQDPWECLASFLLSATKQIVQIQQITQHLRQRLGTPIPVPPGHPPAFAFPTPLSIAQAGEQALRDCRMGFRARHLLEAARRTVDGQFDPATLRALPLDEARGRLLDLPGVGPKIADCVLLFSADQPRAFPIDVWVTRALRHFYFADQPVPLGELRTFAADRFGPVAGYAQQLLFHYARRHPSRPTSQPASACP